MVIEDGLLEPYYIDDDGSNYTVIKRYLNKKQGSVDQKVIGYFRLLSAAVGKIARLKTAEGLTILSLTEYVQVLVKTKLEFDTLLKKLDV